MQKTIRLLTFAAFVASCAAASAASSLWFAAASDPTGATLTSLTVGDVGATFDVAVWYASDVPISAMETMVAFDTSMDEGADATPLDGKLGLDGTAADAFGNLGSGLDRLGSPSVVGGHLDGTGVRGYGFDVAIIGSGLSDIAATSGRRLFTLKLKNTGLGAGDAYSLSFYKPDDSASLYTTYLLDTASNVILPQTTSLRVGVEAVPEPAPMLALAGGALALLRRRRRA